MNSQVDRKLSYVVVASMIFALTLLPFPTHADIPPKINYQGYLTDSLGTPIDATVLIKFSIYDVETGEPALWSETQSVSVKDGIFNVQLGTTPIPLTFDVPYYLGVKVGSDPEMAPRKPLTTVPYAYRAKTVEVDHDTLGNLSCSSGQVPQWNGTSWVCTQVIDSGDITAVSAGAGLTGGGTSGDVNLEVNFAGSGSASTASRSDHDHTGTYAASTHGHAGTDITSGTVAEARIDSAIARVSDVTAHTSRTDNPHLVTALQVGAASAGHNHDTAYQAKYKRTLVVSPIGTAVENADALLAALNGITDASATNPYLLKIEPGIYDVGTSPVQMKQFVDIEGSGETATRITGSGSSSSLTGTLKGANNAELRFLTVENTGGDAYATAIRNGLTSPRITHVTARASGTTGSVTALWNESSSAIMIDVTLSASGGTHTRGVNNTTSSTLTMTNVTATASGASGTNTGIMNNSSSPIMKNVTATAQGGTDSYGVRNYSSSSPTMTNVIASASDASNHNYGVYNSVTGTGFTMMNVTATASGGSGDNFGVFNSSDAEFTMKNVIATATGAPNQNCGVLNSGSSSIMNEVIATAQGGTIAVGITNTCSTSTILNCTAVARDGTQNYGVYNQSCGDSYTVKINNSRIVGSTSTIRNHTGFATYVGASQLNGGDVTLNGGTFTCISVYDENYAGLNGSCQ